MVHIPTIPIDMQFVTYNTYQYWFRTIKICE